MENFSASNQILNYYLDIKDSKILGSYDQVLSMLKAFFKRELPWELLNIDFDVRQLSNSLTSNYHLTLSFFAQPTGVKAFLVLLRLHCK